MDFQTFLQYGKLDSKKYQKEGVEWCIQREQPSSLYCRGGIIADEMGLGKTITMIGLIVCNFKMPNLIILPVVLMEQWKEQFERTAGHTPLIYHGQMKRKVTVDALQRAPVILTTYGTILSDAKSMDKKLQQVSWSRIICDEAHHLRNRRTLVASAVSELKSEIKWLITGTPIQNHMNDIYALFDILTISKKVYTNTDTMKEMIHNIVLKRTKKEVGIKIPNLQIQRISTPWENETERKLSEEIHDKLEFSLLKQKPLEKGMKLEMMLYARKICIHPKLATENIKKISSMGIISEENLDGLNHNSKMNSVTNIILERKNNGNKKIIFANFKGEIDYLQEFLQSNGLEVGYIDGRTPKRKRQYILRQELDVLILQIKTGNEGLNLQKYNEIYFVTPDWNPKLEEQAIARCHRIGQKKQVHVFKFVMRGFDDMEQTRTIEMYSESIQEQKRVIEQNALAM